MADPAPPAKAVSVGSSAASQQTGTEAKETLRAGSVYPGTVGHIDVVSRTLDVVLDDDRLISNCYYMADDVAGVLGISSTALPAKGSRVLVVYGSPCYAIGGRPAYVGDPKDFTAPITGSLGNDFTNYKPFGIQHSKKKKFANNGYVQSQDLIPGEYEKTNNMGVFLRLLSNFSQISSGDLAKVECHLMNDMVRIVDNYYVHHTCGGDSLIWNNGRCTQEEHFTGYPHEAEGKLTEIAKYCSSKGTNVYDVDASCNDTGRWRKSEFVGFLGDIIHTWITDPTTAATSYGKKSKRAGKCRIWSGADGTFMVASMTAIHLEVNPEIVIPYMTAKWDDPTADTSKLMAKMSPKYLKLWGVGPNWDDLKVACWQMRSYSKYFTLYHSLQRWLGIAEAGEWIKVPTEKSNNKGAASNKEEDVKKANPGCDCPYLGHASITIDGSGSICVESHGEKGNGVASVILNQGNIQIASANNLELVCGGCFSVAAKNISMKAVNHVEISAITGGLWLKARTAWNALCEKGCLWLRSYMRKGVAPSPEPLAADIKDVPSVPNEISNYGIKLETTGAPVLVHGSAGIVEKTSDAGAEIKLHTVGESSLINVVSTGTIVNSCTGSYVITGNSGKDGATFIVDKQNTFVKGQVNYNNKAFIAEGVMGLKVGMLTEGYIEANGSCNNIKGGEWGKLKDPLDLEMDPEKTEEINKELEKLTDTISDDSSKRENNYRWTYPNIYATSKGYDWTDVKLAPYCDAFIAGKGKAKDAMKDLVKVNWTRTAPLNKDWVFDVSTGMWPGSPTGAKVGTALGLKAPALGLTPWSRWYTLKDIGGLSKMSAKPYFWMVQNKPAK